MNTEKFKKYFISYSFALAAVGIAFFMRIIIVRYTEPNLATYITFYPFLMFVAVCGGLGPGLLATITSALTVDYWFLPPQGSLILNNSFDIVDITLFSIMGIFINVTIEYNRQKHKKQVDSLRQAYIYNRSLIEVSLDPIVTISREGKITDANASAANILGIIRKKLIGTNFASYFTQPEKAKAVYQRVFATGSILNYPLTIQNINGKLTDVLYNASLYKNDTGNVLGVFATARDVTEQNNIIKKLTESYSTLEEKVRSRTQDLQNTNIAIQNVLEDIKTEKDTLNRTTAKDEAILSSIGDGIIATDPNRKIIIMNKIAEKMLGWKIKKAIGKNYDDVVSLGDENGIIAPEKRPLTKALRYSITNTASTPVPDTAATAAATPIITANLYLFSKNKIKVPVAITVSPIILDNKIIGAVEIFRDTTKEKEVDKAKTEFVSLASHQLRTPLTAISWYTEMILNGDVGLITPDQKKYLEKIYQGDQRMVALVNTLLNVSRLETGSFKIEPQATDIILLARSVLDEQKPRVEIKKLTITENFGHDIPILSTDPKLLRIVFQNLISNSITYTPPRGKIEFAISLNKEEILIKISDTGFGIPKNQQSQIFNKLFRCDNAREQDANGSGLGLYIVKSIVDNFGGKIWFDSEINQGTIFYVALPLKGTVKKEGTKTLE